VVLPVDRNVIDFAARAYEAIQVLAYADEKSVTEVLADVEVGGADVVSVRLTTNAPSGRRPSRWRMPRVAALKDYVVGNRGGARPRYCGPASPQAARGAIRVPSSPLDKFGQLSC